VDWIASTYGRKECASFCVHFITVQPDHVICYHGPLMSALTGCYKEQYIKTGDINSVIGTEDLSRAVYRTVSKSKVKQSRYTPWRRLGGEEI
jgi:hypothetical protein